MRNEKSLIQTVGRAARNVNGFVIMYADKVTKSMKSTIDETNRRRKIQDAYNKKNNIIPKTVNKSKEDILAQTTVANEKETTNKFVSNLEIDPVIKNMSVDEIKKIIEKNSSEMNKAADKLDFYEAARLRDENIELQKILENKS